MTNQPFDFSAISKMFDPEQVAKMFDPERIKEAFSMPNIPTVDANAVMDANRKNFEAMQAANAAATEAYQDFYKKQMAIFEEFMRAAGDQAQAYSGHSGIEAAQKQAEIYKEAMEKALANMTELANAAKKANEDAFGIIRQRVEESIAEIKKT